MVWFHLSFSVGVCVYIEMHNSMSTQIYMYMYNYIRTCTWALGRDNMYTYPKAEPTQCRRGYSKSHVLSATFSKAPPTTCIITPHSHTYCIMPLVGSVHASMVRIEHSNASLRVCSYVHVVFFTF